jgi:seryl-tRNA synthetase
MVAKTVTNDFTELAEQARKLKRDAEHYKKLWNEESQLVEKMQEDKNFMDKKLMAIQELINELPYSDPWKNLINKLIMKARGRV